MEPSRQPRSEIAPETLVVASVGSAAATVVIGRFGLAGTLLGAALFPVVLALAKELARRPARRLPRSLRMPGDRPPEPEPRDLRARLADVRWRRVAATAAAAFGLVAGAFTLVELASGTSLVSDRPTTFLPGAGQPTPAPSPGEPGAPAPVDPAEEDEEEAPPEGPEEPPPTEEPPTATVPEEPPAEETP